MTYTIQTPNETYTGIRCGVAIQSGTGTTGDADAARELKSLGYGVTPDPDDKPARAEKK